jgi:hypothetical protein
MTRDFGGSPAYLDLQPLRVPAGWSVDWNTLYRSSAAEPGGFGGSSLFSATNSGRRFRIDVAFQPEFDRDGRFHLTVEYQPWLRTERGRRSDVALCFNADAETVHHAEIVTYAELVEQLESWIGRCTMWVREGN